MGGKTGGPKVGGDAPTFKRDLALHVSGDAALYIRWLHRNLKCVGGGIDNTLPTANQHFGIHTRAIGDRQRSRTWDSTEANVSLTMETMACM